MTGQIWCGRPGSRPAPIRAPGGARARPLLCCLPAAPLDRAAGGTQNPQARCGAVTHFHARSLPRVRAPCPIAADEPRRALDDDGDSLERPMNRPTLGGYKLTRMCAAAAPTHRLPVARRPTSARPHAPLSLYARRPISSCRRPRRGGLRHRRRACNQARQTGALPPWF